MSDALIKTVLDDHGLRCQEIEFLQDWFAEGELLAESRANEELMYQATAATGATTIFLTGVLEPDASPSMDRLQDRFAELCARAAKHGVTIGLEPCAWSNIGTIETAQSLIAGSSVTNAGLFLDMWHLYRTGVAWSELAALDPTQVIGVQINDAVETVITDVPTDSRDHRLPPGEGDADSVGFLRQLHAIGVNVPVSVEVISIAQRDRPLDEAASVAGSSARSVVDAALTPPRNG